MNILSIFVLIPLLMLLGLWLSRNIKQIRTVMVTGASALVLAAVGLTIAYLQARAAGDTAEMLFRAACTLVSGTQHTLLRGSRRHFSSHAAALCHHSLHRYFRLLASATVDERIFPLVHPALSGCVRLLHFYGPVHHVHVL